MLSSLSCPLRGGGERGTAVGPAPACSWGWGGESRGPTHFLSWAQGPESPPSLHPHSLSVKASQGLGLCSVGSRKSASWQIPGSSPCPPGWHLLLCALERGARGHLSPWGDAVLVCTQRGQLLPAPRELRSWAPMCPQSPSPPATAAPEGWSPLHSPDQLHSTPCSE